MDCTLQDVASTQAAVRVCLAIGITVGIVQLLVSTMALTGRMHDVAFIVYTYVSAVVVTSNIGVMFVLHMHAVELAQVHRS